MADTPLSRMASLLAAVLPSSIASRLGGPVRTEHLMDLYDLDPEPRLLTDGEGRIQDGNRAAAALLGILEPGAPLIAFASDGRVELGRALDAAASGEAAARWVGRIDTPSGEVDVACDVRRLPDRPGREGWLHWALRPLDDDAASSPRGLLALQDAERRRIALLLHDDLGGALGAMSMRLAAARGEAGPDVEALLGYVAKDVDALFERLHDVILDLRPALLLERGLLEALAVHVERLQKGRALEVAIASDGRPRRYAADVEGAVFRVAQEALNNVVRHSCAGRATVRLLFGDRSLGVCVEDDGVGFDATVDRPTAGLSGMLERATAWGGELSIDSRPGRGTRVTLQIPAVARSPRPGPATG